MKRRILCLMMSLVFVFSIVFSSFSVYANDFDINDYIEVHTPEIPDVDNNGDLLQDEIDDSFDDNLYNSPDEIEEEDKDEITFDKKQSYSADSDSISDNINNNDSSTSLKRKSNARSSTYSLNDDSESEISAQSDDVVSDSTNILSEHPISLAENWHTSLSGANFLGFPDTCKLNVVDLMHTFDVGYKTLSLNTSIPDGYSFSDLIVKYNYLFTSKNLIVLGAPGPSRLVNAGNASGIYYTFIFTDCDFYFTNIGSGNFYPDFDLLKSSTFFCYTLFVNYDNSYKFVDYRLQYVEIYENGVRTPLTAYNTILFNNDDPFQYKIYYTGGHSVYVNNEKVEKADGSSDILGNIIIEDNGVDLYWQAKTENEITDDTSYDVKLFAIDIDNAISVPSSLTENVRYCDLSKFYNCDGIIDKEHQFIYDNCDLEHIYYYIHQLKAYDDSDESVRGYKFEAFEIRNTTTFVVGYRLKDSGNSYTVCMDSIFVYNYEKTIDEVMSDYTVKKDYLDFPDINDYIEDLPDVEDFLPEGEEPGVIDWILAYVKWIGACLKTFGKNFIGFFKWLKDCVPIVWENLGIALYNMVCDLKSLALYLFKPKTKSINILVNSKIPGFTAIRNSFNNTDKANLPYIKLFGTKFGFDFSVIDSKTKTFLYNLSTILIYIFFATGIIKLIGKVFGFNIHSSSDDDNSDDS